ncbi:MAG: S8 family serine peptidase [Bacteroidota bacterium]|nr:S8 family serine peptidase [Bacteroidota bacterium]
MRLLTFLLIFSISLLGFSQQPNSEILLKSGTITPANEINLIDLTIRSNEIFKEKYYRFMQFSVLPSTKQKEKLERLGVRFLEYIPNNTFLVSISDNLSKKKLTSFNVIALIEVKVEQKIHPKLQNGNCPDWAKKGENAVLEVLLYKDVDLTDAFESLKVDQFNIKEINTYAHSFIISSNLSNLQKLASHPFVHFIAPIDPPSYPENKTGRTLHRSNVINAEYSNGRHYNGEGINIMMQDDGEIGPHIDYQGRIDQSAVTSSSGSHGDHVAGTIMGAGNLDPYGRGMADGAFLYVYSSSNNNYYSVPGIYQNNDVIITSKSYSNGCNAGYTSLARDLDEQVRLYPSLIHVFSAGNDGTSDCGYGAGSNWGNVTGGHKQAKNVIATANLTSSSGLANSSSRGPAHDGRIKPDIGAKGSSVYSTVSTNDYDTYTGTSMACPGIAGVLGQLYQAYKELNGGQNPPSGLMKGVLLNTADDLGNSGPDFKYGWGEVNALRAIQILENQHYFEDSISHLGNNTHNITIPTGTKQLKLMVYWHDKQASASASIALINNLDISLSEPSGTNYQPWVLDHTPNTSNLNQPATRGVDDRNNMEQITLDNPADGNYTLSVSGTSIPYGPQKYYVVYDIISEGITLTYPNGGEGLVPGENEMIRWDAFGNTGTFTLEFSLNNGMTWGNISSNVNSSIRYFNWTVPNNVSGDALIRVSRGLYNDQSDENFTIIPLVQNFMVDWTCPDSIYFNWNPVAGANGYEISMLGQKYMDSIVSSTANSAFYHNTNPANTDNWFAIRALISPSKKGGRTVAVNKQPTNNSCLAPPFAIISASTTNSCSGIISFSDNSLNMPNSWLWDFGDGTTSNQENPTHNYQSQGVYTVSLTVSNALGTDSVVENNLITISYSPAPIAYNDTICADSTSFNLISYSIGQINWYNDTSSGNIIHTGNTYTTPVLNTSTNYYLTEDSPIISGGPLDTNIGGGAFYYGIRHMIFDCFAECNLVAADVYADVLNTITFELRDNSGVVLDDTTITVIVGKQTLYLDFDIPVGNDLQLGVRYSNSGLFRNNNGATFPQNIGNLLSFTGANISSAQDNWYFYYNLQLKENCKSEYKEITAVLNPPLLTPIITQNGNQLSTTNNPLYAYQWYLSGVAINGSNSSSINITQGGQYTVEVQFNGCTEFSANFLAIYSSVDEKIQQIVVHPNPLKDLCVISSDMHILSISILDIGGKILYDFENLNSFAFTLNLSKLSNGIYFAKVTTANTSIKHKLIIQR